MKFFLTLSAFALAASSPADDAKHDQILKKVWTSVLAGKVQDIAPLMSKDIEFSCDQTCVDADWCWCKSTSFGYDEVLKPSSGSDEWAVKQFEPTIYHDEDGKTLHAHIKMSATNKNTGKPVPIEEAFETVVFDDAGLISKVLFSLPSTPTAEQSKKIKQAYTDFIEGKDVMKYYDPSATLDCSKSCVDAKWCSCGQTGHNDFAGLSKIIKSIQPNFLKNFQDVTINGKKLTKSSSLKKFFLANNTVFIPYVVAGSYKGSKIPTTPVLEMLSFTPKKLINKQTVLFGEVMKIDIPTGTSSMPAGTGSMPAGTGSKKGGTASKKGGLRKGGLMKGGM